jgi:pilus assembly protein CpaE
MSQQTTRVLIAHDASTSGDWVIKHISGEGGVTVDEVLSSLSTRSDALKSSDADILVIACGNESDAALDLVEWWVGNGRRRPVVVLCQNSPNGFVQRAFSVGADDLVVLEPGPEISAASARSIRFALEKVMVRRRAPGKPEVTQGAMICVLGPKGGIGKTVTCCNLALSLATMRHRVALVDLDLQFGDVALSLGMRPERTVHDLVLSGGSLDAEKIEAYMTLHQTGLRVLAAPIRPDQAGIVTPDFITTMTSTLRTAYDFLVIDTPPSFGPEVIAAIDASSHICMIGMLDSLSLKNTRLGLETLELMGYPPDRIRVILNRANTNVGITGDDVVSVLGRAPDILIPSSRDLTRSVNQGDPIVLSQKRSEAARAFNALAMLFAPPPKSPRRGGRNRIRLGRSRG